MQPGALLAVTTSGKGDREKVGLDPKMTANFKHILIAVDGEPVSAHAAEIGLGLARSLGAEVAFLHAIEPGLTYSPGVAPKDLVGEAEQDARKVLAGFRSLSPDLSILEFVQVGKPPHEIVNAAKTWPADLIVMGSHGRHGISRALLGSVAEAVMRYAPCPVLVIPAKRE